MPLRRVLRAARSLSHTAAMASVVALGAACGGPKLGDLQISEITLTLTGTASQPDVAAIGESAGGLSVTRAYVSASSLSLLPCSKDAAHVMLGPRGYDLLLEPPPSEGVTTAVTELCGLRLDVDPLSENALEGVPEGASLFVEGNDADGAPFQLSSDSSLSLLLEADEDASFGAAPLLLGFDVSLWLAGIPLAEDRVDDAVELLEAQLESAAALYVDGNDDQRLDDDEKTPVAQASAPR